MNKRLFKGKLDLLMTLCKLEGEGNGGDANFIRQDELRDELIEEFDKYRRYYHND